MAERRIVGSHFNKQGKPKRGYVKEEVAKAEAARFGMTYYRCDVCEKLPPDQQVITRTGDARSPRVRFYVPMSGDSDLIGIPVTLGAIVAILAVFAAFFFIGPVTGIVVLLAVVVIAGVLLVRLIRANEM